MNSLELKNISTYIDGRKILDDVSMKFTSGKIYAVVGENSSGKSTIAKVVSGLTVYNGDIRLDNKILLKRKNKLLSKDIATVYQNNYLQKNLSVIENVFIGKYSFFKKGLGFVDSNKIKKRFKELIEITHFPISANTKISRLSYVEKRMVEILKVLAIDSKVFIFDTLFDNINENEKTLFHNLLIELTKKNKIVIYLSHKIKEALLISDYISVISKGSIIYSSETSKASKSKVIRALCREPSRNKFPHLHKPKGQIVLSCKNLHTDKVQNINFSLFRGEILGITGLIGSGKSSIGKVISGLQGANKGDLVLFNNKVQIKNPVSANKYGIGFMTGVNTKDLVPSFKPCKNITLSNMNRVSSLGFISDKKEAYLRRNIFSHFSISNEERSSFTKDFSAGTQKKLCIAKILFANTKILILNEPTLGIDSASKSDVYNLLIDYVSKGNSIILISSDFSEISGLADRAIIIKEGKMIGELLHDDLSKEKILFDIYN